MYISNIPNIEGEVNMAKNRIEMEVEYNDKYGDIPKDFQERLEWLHRTLNISDGKAEEIIARRDMMIHDLSYYSFKVILYEEPDGAKRPRFRLINRKNIANMAMMNPDFIHVYSPNAKSDNVYMKRLIDEEDFIPLNHLIATPCIIDINTFHKTPSNSSKGDIILSEIGLIRAPVYPDWDNIGKKYSDMFNANVWIDDMMVIDGSVHKYFSVLPRVEINISYLNMTYTKNQYKRMTARKDYNENMNLKYFGMEE